MKIYLYDKNTFEYLQSLEADADPEETKIQGHFIPLLPACSTLIAPPEYGENEIPVFSDNSWIVNPDFRGKFYKGNQVVRKTTEEIEQEIFNQRKEQFESAFFSTSLGYIRRKVTMKNGLEKDFLGDLILPIKAGIEMGRNIKVITYQEPDFSQESTNEYMESLQEVKDATIEIVQECLNQIVADFGIEMKED